MDIWDYVFGAFRILIGACIALWVGTAFFIALNFASDLSAMEPLNPEAPKIFTFFIILFATPITAIIVAQLAIYPMLLIVCLSEIAAKKDVIFYMICGSVTGIAFIAYGASRELPFASDLFRCLVVICSCIVGSFVYWLIAGRNAGRFLERIRSD
ncbi:hypothetical protein ACFQ3K_08120 [Brucella gallinifaecis]|uniref:Uncharacterized protein n=1 Tax=Brucella gallinifaecis TaxID=215590 RepID=A0A502BNS0_9HYPH|nr:hypothetical protein [Brucella gallinifaecis]TPF75409.1 hypothetical protein FHY56_09090 [Brucella gallinifaecis]